MHRFFSAALLICFALLAPQVVPMRVCFLENKSHPSGFHSYGISDKGKSKCCKDCGSSNSAHSSTECCVDLNSHPDTPTSLALKKWLPLTGVLSFSFQIQEIIWPALDISVAHLDQGGASPPLNATQRQASLSVWTV